MMFHKAKAKVENSKNQNSVSMLKARPFKARRASALAFVMALVMLFMPVAAGANQAVKSPQNPSLPPEAKSIVRTGDPSVAKEIAISFAAKAFRQHQAARARLVALRKDRARKTQFLRLMRNPVNRHILLLISLRGPSPWDPLAWCETQGNWEMKGRDFSGGTGMANSTFSGLVHGIDPRNGRSFANDLVQDFGYPENGGDASREQQIVVAERMRVLNHGTPVGAWGCGKYYGT